jgi:tryptophan synthase alpha chain
LNEALTLTGVERIAEAFAAARADGRRAALMPYLMGGFPDLERSREILIAYADNGADLIELGVPFSDPLADGPVVHAAGVAALNSGVRVQEVISLARAVSDRVAVVVMCYANLVFARGVERFADELVVAGAAGLIVPDLPFEEAPAVLAECDKRGLALVPLAAPTTPEDRLREIGARARGFLYAVSLTGTTGERAGMRTEAVSDVISRAAAATSVPVAVGFGIGTPEQAAATADAGADGVIIGSRLVRAAGESEDPAAAVGQLVKAFSSALNG